MKMASSSEMSPKRDHESDRNQPNLRLADCKCPICMCILIEPVRMPCNHELCMLCFRKNVGEANFTCPMCRLRISSWARRRARENKLVDERRWRQIRQAFPDHCRRRLTGEEEVEEEEILDFSPVKRICEPGAIKQEYMEAIEKLRCEHQQMEEIEIKKSEEYIAWLQREEVRLYEEQQTELAQQQKQDEEMARKMSQGSSPMQEEIRAHIIQEQEAKDEEFARRLQKEISESSDTMSSPQNTTTIISKKSSRNSSRSSNASTSSSIKCRRIDTFLSPSTKQTSNHSRNSSKASSSKSTNNSASSPVLSISSTSSRGASSDLSVSSLDFDKPSTSNGEATEAVLIGDPPWGDRSSSDCILEVVVDPASPEVMYPSPGSDSESSKNFKGCLLSSEFVLDTKVDLTGEAGKEKKGSKESAFESVGKKSFEGERIETKSLRKRSDSMTSTDSISPELNHFRPIDVSPRTSHRRLANGKKESPQIIHTTPRNLSSNLIEDESTWDATLPPLVKAKFESLIKEKRKKLPESSKGTMTGKAAPGATSTLMRQELNKRLHRKPSGSRHTLIIAASHKQKSPLADNKIKSAKYTEKGKHRTLKNVSEEEKRHSSETLPKRRATSTYSDSIHDADVVMTDLDATSPPTVGTENGSKLESTAFVNGSSMRTKEDREIKTGNKERNVDQNSTAKRKSCSPQKERKRLRLGGTSPQVSKEVCGSGELIKSAANVTRSPGKVYRMRANYPKSKQSSIKQLADQDHSVSPKRRKEPSGQGMTPPLPSLIPSPHVGKLKTDNRKLASPHSNKPAENSQENVAKVETDRPTSGVNTPDKGVLMDTTRGANQEHNREHNGKLERVRLGEATSPSGRKSNARSPQEIRPNHTASIKSRPNNVSASLPSANDHPKSSGLLQKTPSKTRRNTIWKYMELVGEEERRIKQEEEDRRLALRLQEEFDKQERRQMSHVDRTRGTDAAYELRFRRSSRKVGAAVVEVDSDDDIFA